MFKKFSIIKKSYLWLTIGWVLLVLSWISFFSNVRFSEEFTGGVKIGIWSVADTDKLKTDMENYLVQNKYEDNVVVVEQADGITNLSIKTKVEKDEQVNELSKQVKTALIEGFYIKSADDIVSQTITWPSVGEYMQSSAKWALITWLILMAI